jgi:hypothetical protein
MNNRDSIEFWCLRFLEEYFRKCIFPPKTYHKVFQTDMVLSFKKGHLLANMGTSPGRVDVQRSKGQEFFWAGFWTLIKGEEG